MTKQQAEQILALTNTPGWKTFIELKQEALDKLHLALEWDASGIQKAQGQIIEIRSDLALQKRAAGVLSMS